MTFEQATRKSIASIITLSNNSEQACMMVGSFIAGFSAALLVKQADEDEIKKTVKFIKDIGAEMIGQAAESSESFKFTPSY